MHRFKFYRTIVLLAYLFYGGPAAAQQILASGADADFVYAEQLEKDGYIDLAIEQYELFLKKYPTEKRAAVAWRRIAEGYFRLQQYESARMAFETLLIRFPRAQESGDALKRIGDCFSAEKKYVQAARSYERYARLTQPNELAAEAFILAAEHYIKARETDRGIRLLQETIELFPQDQEINAQARLLLLRQFVARQQYDRAMELAESFVQHFSEILATPEVWLIKGRLHKLMGQYGEALSSYFTAMQKFPQTPEALEAAIRAAELQFYLGKADSAFHLLNTFAALDDSSRARLAFKAAHLYLLANRPSDALRALENTPEGWRNVPEYWDQMAQIYLRLQDFTAAQKAFAAAATDRNIENDSLRIHYLARAILTGLRIGALEQVEQYYRWLRKLSPDLESQPKWLLLAARVEEEALHNIPKAIRLYSRFIDLYRGHPMEDEAQARLAMGYEKLQNWAMAKTEWQRLLQHYPASRWAYRAQGHIRLIEAYRMPDFSKLATKLAGTLSKAHNGPLSTSVPLQTAEIYMEFREFEKAIPVLKEALAQTESPGIRAQALLLLGRAYFALGELHELNDITKAKAWYDSAAIALQLILKNFRDLADVAEVERLLGMAYLRSAPEQHVAFLDSLSRTYSAAPSFGPIHLFVLEKQVQNFAQLDSLQRTDLLNRLVTLSTFDLDTVQDRAGMLLARAYLLSADTLQARQLLESVSSRSQNAPGGVQAQYMLARLMLQARQQQEAISLLRRIADAYYYSPLADSAYLQLARLSLSLGSAENAIEYLKTLERRLHEDGFEPAPVMPADFLLLSGRAYEATGRTLEAIQRYLQFLQHYRSDPRAPEVLFSLGKINQKLLFHRMAISYFEEIYRMHSRHPLANPARMEVSRMMYDRGEYTASRQLALEVLREATTEAEERRAMRQAILAGLRMGKLAALQAELKNYAGRFPDDLKTLAEIQFEIGDLYIRRKNFKKAEETFKRIRKTFKNTEYAIFGDFGLGKALLVQNKTDDALEILTAIPERYPDHPFLRTVYLNLGDFYQAQQQWDSAVQAFRRIVSDTLRDRTYQLALRSLINLYERRGAYDAAMMYTRRYLKEFPEDDRDLSLRIKIGGLLRRMGQYDEAIRHYRKLLVLADLQTRMEIQYYIGESYFESGRFEQAIVEYMKLKYTNIPTKFPWQTTAIYKSGISYMRLQNYERARELFEWVIRKEGAASVFGRSAREKIYEIEKALSAKPKDVRTNGKG